METAAGRTPWEQPTAAFPTDLFRSWMQVMTRPVEFFRSLDPAISFGRPLLFYLVFAVLGSGASILSSRAALSGFYREMALVSGSDWMYGNAYAWLSFFFSPFWALLGLLIYVGMAHLGVRVFVKSGRPIGVTARTLCYVIAPSVMAIVPFVGWAVSFFWTTGLAIVGVQWTHGTTFGRAFAAVVLPWVVLMVALFSITFMFGILLALAIGGSL